MTVSYGEKALVLLSLYVFQCAGAGCSPRGGSTGPAQLTVMTFNVLCSFCDSSYPPFDERLEYFGDIFDRYDPDLIGLQELTWPEEVQSILSLLPGFEAVHYEGTVKGPLGMKDYPDATIFFRKSRFDLVGTETFWLSPTPDVPWSAGFSDGGQFPRVAVMARLFDRESNRNFLFFTTHVDNNSPSQEKSAPLILERLDPYMKVMPVVVTGDFNSTPTSNAYKILTSQETDRPGLIDSYDIAEERSFPSNRPGTEPPDPGERIDHVFIGGEGTNWSCRKWTSDLYMYGEPASYPSDHRAVVAELYY